MGKQQISSGIEPQKVWNNWIMKFKLTESIKYQRLNYWESTVVVQPGTNDRCAERFSLNTFQTRHFPCAPISQLALPQLSIVRVKGFKNCATSHRLIPITAMQNNSHSISGLRNSGAYYWQTLGSAYCASKRVQLCNIAPPHHDNWYAKQQPLDFSLTKFWGLLLTDTRVSLE